VRARPLPPPDPIESWLLERVLPQDHELLQIRTAVTWSSVDEETADLYSPGVGRPAYPASALFRMLFLEFYADLSDVEVAEQCRYNLLYRAFVGLPLGGPTPDDTTLVVFRRRLGVERFRHLFDALIVQCQALGLLEGRLKIVDATHVVANVAIPNTVNLLREARRRLVASIEADGGEARPDLRERYQTNDYIRGVPTAETLAASAHLSEQLLAESAEQDGPRVVATRGILEQVLRPTAGRLSSVVDPEARLGHKTPSRRFIGYKLHIAEDTSELVTTVQVLPGNGHEGSHLPELLQEEAGKRVHQEALVADALYDSAANRAAVRRHGATPHIPRRRHRTRADRFTYDRAADALRCPQGHLSTHRTIEGLRTRFSFSPAVCRGCPAAEQCPPPNKGRVRVNVSEHHLARLRGAPSAGKLIEYERKRIERKFGQAKTNHGLRRARYLGAAKVLIQGLLTFFVLNAKRVVRLQAGPPPQLAAATV
jgi:IS5 family transposase